jgi:hypothetical protein
MDDGIGPAERLDRLAKVGQVGVEEASDQFARRNHVDVEHIVAAVDEVADNGTSGLAAAACHDHSCHRRLRAQCLWLGKPWVGSAGCA